MNADAFAIASYPREQLEQEIAYVAYHFHWSRDELLDLEHAERHAWMRQIARINRELDAARERG